MIVSSLSVGKLRSGGFKVYVWGQPDLHLSNWRGCNFRYKAVDGQPHRGFATLEEAVTFGQSKFSSLTEVRKWARSVGDGSFLTDEEFVARGFDKSWSDIKLPD